MIDAKVIAVAVALLVQLGGIVWWASMLQSAVSHNDYQIQMIARDTEKHAIFVRDWPVGRLGALPSDVRQDLLIQALEKKVDRITGKLWNGNP